jgi:hypothetical protein
VGFVRLPLPGHVKIALTSPNDYEIMVVVSPEMGNVSVSFLYFSSLAKTVTPIEMINYNIMFYVILFIANFSLSLFLLW